MIKNLKIILTCAALSFSVSTITMAAELTNGQDIAQEAISVANQYQSIATTIKTQSDNITVLGEAHSVLNISIVEKVKAIIQAIQFESQNLVDLVMNENPATNSKKVDSILSNLESQRNSLTNLIGPQLESTADFKLKPEDKQEIGKAFQVYQE